MKEENKSAFDIRHSVFDVLRFAQAAAVACGGKAERAESQRMNLRRGPLALAAAALLMTFLSGCATNATSDMPWNTPQPWEGSPSIPGFQGR
jgi:hypothetical protein